jgi:hypothetical protein
MREKIDKNLEYIFAGRKPALEVRCEGSIVSVVAGVGTKVGFTTEDYRADVAMRMMHDLTRACARRIARYQHVCPMCEVKKQNDPKDKWVDMVAQETYFRHRPQCAWCGMVRQIPGDVAATLRLVSPDEADQVLLDVWPRSGLTTASDAPHVGVDELVVPRMNDYAQRVQDHFQQALRKDGVRYPDADIDAFLRGEPLGTRIECPYCAESEEAARHPFTGATGWRCELCGGCGTVTGQDSDGKIKVATLGCGTVSLAVASAYRLGGLAEAVKVVADEG